MRWKKLPLWKIADVLAPSIALGSVFGRIGCLLNGCCYGRACDLPWAITFSRRQPAPSADHAGASDGNLRRAAESRPLCFSRVAVPPQKIRRPDFCDLSDLLRHHAFVRGIFSRRLHRRALSFRPHPRAMVSVPIFITGLALAAILSRRTETKRRIKNRGLKMANAQVPIFHPPSFIFVPSSSPAQPPSANPKSPCALAEKIGGEIISVDSMQVYRGLDIGTAKPSPAERDRVPHHLIDICDLTKHSTPRNSSGSRKRPSRKSSRAGDADFLRRHRTLFQGVLERTRRSARHRSRIARRIGSRAV